MQGAVFHDGEAITSEDVKFSMETSRPTTRSRRCSRPSTPSTRPTITPWSLTSANRTRRSFSRCRGLRLVIPEHVYNDGQEIKEHPCNAGTDCFVGSGPFTLAEYEAGSIIRLEAFEDFFIPERPYLDEIIIEIVPDPATIVLGLENGDTDLALPMTRPTSSACKTTRT